MTLVKELVDWFCKKKNKKKKLSRLIAPQGEMEGNKETEGRGQPYLRGGKGASVRMSIEGVVRNVAHHAGAVHRRANALEPEERLPDYLHT